MYRPDLCKDCKKPCCTRPALTTDEYVRLFNCVGNSVLQRHEPHFMESTGMWMFKRGSCPAVGDEGCVLPYDERPQVCRLFPYVTVPFYTDVEEGARDELVLLVGRCPQWRAFGELYEQTKEEMNGS
jgi:Fe-S-cluster containining protein